MWSVYDGIITPGPTPKLVGPKSYNQVTRHLATKVFRGLQVCCSARTLAQFDEPSPPKVRSVILVPSQCEIARKTEAMDTASPKAEDAEEGAVGGELCMDPDKYPMAWMRDHQHWYDNEQIEFWPLLHLLTDGKGATTWQLVHAAFCQCGTGLPPPIPHPALPPQPTWRSDDGCH